MIRFTYGPRTATGILRGCDSNISFALQTGDNPEGGPPVKAARPFN